METEMRYRHLKPYRRPENYMGAEWYGYYDVVGRHRDSDTLTESNWQCWVKFLTKLLGEPDQVVGTEPVPVSRSAFDTEEGDEIYNWTICRESHWAVGWIEIIRVHESVGVEKLNAIDDQLRKLDGYPVFDEDHFSQLEDDERQKQWEAGGSSDDWYDWLRKHIGEERFDLLDSVYHQEIESLLYRAYEQGCRDSSQNYTYPDDNLDIEQLVRLAEPHGSERMNRLIENLYAAEAANT